MYEHTHHIDQGANAAEYADAYMNHIACLRLAQRPGRCETVPAG
jgi:hypothetical protein